MALGRVKNWIVEVLTASDLNAEFNNILNNPISLISPLTGTLDADGNEIVLDGGGTSSITADTNSRVDLKLNGTDLFKFDGTATTPVNGLQFTAAAASSEPDITAFGSDTDIDINLIPKGAGAVRNNGVAVTRGYAFSDTNDVTINQAWPTGVLWSTGQTIVVPTSGFILLLPSFRCDNATGGTRDYHIGLQINSTDYFPSVDINGTPNQQSSEHSGGIPNGEYRTREGSYTDAVFGLDIEGQGISTGSQTVRPIVAADASTATSTLKGATVTSRLKILIIDTSAI